MRENEELIFTVMVTSAEVLEEEIKSYNDFFKTDFKILEVIDDEVPFCKIRVTNYTTANIFGLGFCLARLEQKLREQGKIDW